MPSQSTVPKVPRDGTLTFSTSVLTYILVYEQGDFSGDGFDANMAEPIDVFDRDVWMGRRKGKQRFATFSFTAWMTQLIASTGGTIWDVVNKTGAWSAAVSTISANADWFACTAAWGVLGSVHGDGGDNTLTLNKCDLTIGVAEGAPNKFSVSGTALGGFSAAFA